MIGAKDIDSVDVFYLARGADEDFAGKARRFVESYRRYPAGAPHRLILLLKGFHNRAELRNGLAIFEGLDLPTLNLPDDGFDIEAYYRAAFRSKAQQVCFLNTSAVLNGDLWLAKLRHNLDRPGVALVGATGSYEGAVGGKLQYPNPHVRTNAFMMARQDFLMTRQESRLTTKMDAYELEHGERSITAQCLASGRFVLVVGKDGRGYPPYLWPTSGTFRQGLQENLLVRDGQTEFFAAASVPLKQQLFHLAWREGDLVEDLRIWNPAPAAVPGSEMQS